MRHVRSITRGVGQALPLTGGVIAGAALTQLLTRGVRKIPKFDTPGILYDWVAPTIAAVVTVSANELLLKKYVRNRMVQDAVPGVHAGAGFALAAHVAAKLGVPGFQTGVGTAGVGILVAEETASLEAIVAEAEANGFALAALSDGTLAEITIDGLRGDDEDDDDDDGTNGTRGLMESMTDQNGEEDGDVEGMGAGVDVNSGGVGAGVDVNSGGVGSFAGGFGSW